MLPKRYRTFEGPLRFVEALQIREIRGESAEYPELVKVLYDNGNDAVIEPSIGGVLADVGVYVVAKSDNTGVSYVTKDDFESRYIP